ncbi:phosphotransferase system, mannose/fructose-specific component IIA [Desulfuromonas soudanensis]|uniref:Phosphotransferase system, mannose/fructose-specific component IIA n=1 Tax=Desulfuromonas soudanensis TaxID=1603606 RepID=A0A0M4DGP5_9BACT|nr:PTS sugar transporter subunit IIA [Desulfuromonas soudanensis]ALC16087.1 phosphotransferase system, mannose/fructose-specific component IIA [Desulfuromonas soudanensis]
MIGLIIATHSRLAEDFLHAAEMIIGPVKNALAVAIDREMSVESIRTGLSTAIDAVGVDGEGVLVMTDMFGGTPANIAISFLDPGRLEVLTGVNLPMVLKFFNSQGGLSLVELAALLKAYGQQNITLASDFLQR